MRKFQVVGLLLCVFVFGGVSLTTNVRRAIAYGPNDGTYYVSPTGSDSNSGTKTQPFATIDKARQAVRSLIAGGMTSDVVVMIRGGRYYQTSPVVFTDQDSGVGGHKVVYTNYPGEEPIIVGGSKIGGWTYDTGYPGEDVYKAYVGRSFNELYEDGALETKARTPNQGSYLAVPTVSTQHHMSFPTDSFFPSGAGAGSQVYIWSGDKTWDWFNDTIPIQSVSGGTVNLSYGTMLPIETGDRYYVQGFADALDTPGEWFLDGSGYVHYWPQHTPIDDQEIVAPQMTDVFELKGSSSTSKAQNITFDGLTFLGSDFSSNFDEIDHDNASETDTGVWNEPAAANRHGIVYLENASHDTIKNCKITGAGFNGVEVNTYSDHNTITGNEIHQSGYFGVMLTGTDVGTVVSGAQVYDNHDNTVSDNEILNSGQNVGNGGGIFLFQSGDNQIEHNVIDGAPRYGIGVKGTTNDTMMYSTSSTDANTGLPLGDGGHEGGVAVTWDNHWDFDTTRNNDIEYNDISHVNQDSQDAGIISLIGVGKGNVIANNRLHDVHEAITSGGNELAQGVYLDDGTDYTTVRGNIVYGMTGGDNGGYFVKGTHNTVTNNVFVGGPDASWGIWSQWFSDPTYLPSYSNTFTKNILYNSHYSYHFDNWHSDRLIASDYNDVYDSSGTYPLYWAEATPDYWTGGSDPAHNWVGMAAPYGPYGSSPPQTTQTYGSISVDNTPSASNKSLKLVDTDGTSGNGVAVDRFFQDSTQGVGSQDDVTFQYDVMASQTSGAIFADLLADSGSGTTPGTSALSVGLSADGHIRCWTATGYTDFGTYAANTWYTIKVVAHLSSHTYDVQVGSSSGCTGSAFSSNVNVSWFQVATGAGTGTFYVDKVSVDTSASGSNIEEYFSEPFDGYTSGSFPTFDQHSITSDPLFTDPSSGDYTLQSTSPALANGFVDLDYANMGLDSSYHLVRGVSATSTSGGVAVTWEPVSGASSYVVRRTDDWGDSYTSVGTPAGTTYTDSTALDGKTYFYTVAAVVGGVEYPASDDAEADTGYAVALGDDTFDSETTGAAPSGYALGTSGGTVVVADVPGSGNKSMELTDTASDSTGASATRSFTSSTAPVAYEVRVMASQTTGGVSFDLYDGSGTAAVTVALSGAGTVRYWNSSGTAVDVGSYNANQWYTLRIVANVASQTFDLSVDGVPTVTPQAFENTVSSLSELDIATGFSTGTYDVDYVSISQPALIDDPYDGETTSSAPAGYTVDASVGSVAIANTPGSGNKSLELTDSDSSSAGVSAFKTFNDQLGTITCEIRIRASQTTGGAYVELDDAGTPAVQVALSGDDHIRLWTGNGTTHTDVQTYTSGAWYTLKMVADISTHTYVFYVNGTAYASGAAQAFDNNVNVINRLTLATGFATGTYDVDYVDVTGS